MSSYINGYGVNLNMVPKDDMDFLSLIKMDKDIYDDYKEYLKDIDVDTEDNDSAYGYVSDAEFNGYFGLCSLLCNIININEGLELCCDEQDTEFGMVFYPEVLPWKVNEKMRNITREELDDIFRKYINVLTKTPLIISEITLWVE